MKANPVSWLSSALITEFLRVLKFCWIKFLHQPLGFGEILYSSFGCCDLSFEETWPGSKTLMLRVSANGPQSSCYVFNQR